MQNLKKNYFAKLMMVITVIFTMLFSTIAPIVSYAAETYDNKGNIVESDYVHFNLNWGNGTNEITSNYGTISANFSIQFDTINYFTDFRIVVEKADNVTVTLNNEGQYYGAVSSGNQTQYLNKIPGGTRLNGSISFNFAKSKDYSDYSRDIKVKLIGIYEKDGEEYFVEITKNLKANISTKDDVYQHTASLGYLYSGSGNDRVTSSLSYESNTNILMKVRRIQMSYPILVTSERSEHTKIEMDIYRTIGTGDQLRKIYPTSVTMDYSLSSKGYTLTNETDDDGNVKYYLEKGAKNDEFNSSKLYSLNSPNGKINVIYDLKCPEYYDGDEGDYAVSTYTYFDNKLTSDGWTQTINADGTSNTATTIAASQRYTQSFSTYRYTPGTYEWGNTHKTSYGSVYGTDVQNFAEGKTNLDFTFRTYATYVTPGDIPTGDTKITETAPTIKWYNYSTSRYETRTLQAGEGRIKEISVDSLGFNSEEASMKFYKPGSTEPFFTADKDHLKYTFPDDDNTINFTVVAKDMVKNKYYGYYIYYEAIAENLIANGITAEKLSNLREISQSQDTDDKGNMYGDTLTATIAVSGFRKEDMSNLRIATSNLNRYWNGTAYSYDYNTNLNTSSSDKGKDLSTTIYLSLSTLGMSYSDSYSLYSVKTTNPTVYVVLPDEFDFIINSVTVSQMSGIKLKDYKIKIVNGKKILVIEGEGSFVKNGVHGYYDGFYGFKVDCTRRLKQGVLATSGTLAAYMESDEQRYYYSQKDIMDLNENDSINDSMSYSSMSFNITDTSRIQIISGATAVNGDIKTNEDVILPAGSTVKYSTILDNRYTTIKNINIVTRLPFEGNKSIKSAEGMDLESDTTFTNLRNIKVYSVNSSGSKTEIASRYYTIGYSDDEGANLDSTYVTDSSTLDSVKTLQVKFNSSYYCYSSNKILIEYEMDIPDDAEVGKASSQIAAARYTTSGGVALSDQESAKIKVVIGDPKGKIEVVKTFSGAKPNMDVSKIKIKIQNMYNEEQYFEKLTDEDGHAMFENVPDGYWKVTEETEFNDFECNQTKYVIITNGEKYIESLGKHVNLVNEPKWANVTLYKTWKDASENVKNDIRFYFKGTTVGGDEYTNNWTTYLYTDNEGNKVQKLTCRIPYGEYNVSEEEAKIDSYNSYSQWGWTADSQTLSVHQPEIEISFENEIAYGSLKIIKTVPDGEDAKGLKFHLYGRGDASYKNNNGEFVYQDVDRTFTIGEDGTATVDNLPLGTYTIEEIEMPTVSILGGKTERYIPIRKFVRVTKKNGVDEYNIDNKYKKGNINVIVTATGGSDKSLFKVKVQGKSYYGTTINQVYDVPETGNLTINDIPIGKYKVTEYNTREENGKIYTNDPDGYEVTYNPTIAPNPGVEVEYKKTTQVFIHNAYNGEGYLKINKTIEGEDNPSSAAGIKFILRGKNLVGDEHEEVITIGEDGIGRSGAIPVGTYLLTEVEDSVPKKYALAEEKEVTIKRAHTKDNPLEIDIENKIATNEIKMDTELSGGGYPPLPVTYKVTKINDQLEPIEDPVTILGDKKSHAELLEMKAGRYLIEQESVPSGYIKDDPQVVSIDRDTPGYALFIISKPDGDDFENTRLSITKQIVNEKGEIASDEDFARAKLDSRDKYSFEFKLVNTDTNEVFYSFAEEKATDTLVGLPYGNYTIEEVYKPKFNFVEMTGEKITNIEGTKKYAFTFTEDGSTLQNSVYITVRNEIDYDFGFGGQDHKDNLSKVLVEEQEREFVPRAKIYIRDDENNRVSDATFKLLDSDGNPIKFTGNNGIYVADENGEEILTPEDGAIIVKGLPVGTYKLVNETVGEGYLPSADKDIIIYKDVVGVNRIETLRNIPRGSLKLSTVYKDEDGVENYTPRSKYKILNPETSEVLTFIKKADGTYYRSNLPTATETIAIKEGYVNVEGIEAGIEYQVGLVDVTEKYGIIDTEPETIVIEEGVDQEIKTEVKDRSIKFIKVETMDSGTQAIALDSSGKIWAYDNWSSPYSGSKNNYNLICVNDLDECVKIKDVKFVDFFSAADLIAAVDTEGKLWTWGWGNSLADGSSIPVCVSDIEGSELANIKVKQVAYKSYSGETMYILDEDGKIWFRGNIPPYVINEEHQAPWALPSSDQVYCTNLSEKCDLANVTIVSMAPVGVYNQMIAIDNTGKVWTWGNNNNSVCGKPYDSDENYILMPTCISNLEGSNIKNVKMKKAACSYYANYLIDTDGNLWSFGSTDYYSMAITGERQIIWNPICLSNQESGSALAGLKFKDVAAQYETIAAIDIDGKLWTWGYESDQGQLGLGESYSSRYGTSITTAPICVSDLDNNQLDNHELTQVAAPYYNVAGAVDSEGNLWMWGDDGVPCGSNDSSVKAPASIPIANNAHFDIPRFTKIDAGYYNCAGIDEKGKVWTWGYNYNYTLGIANQNSSYTTQTPVRIGGKNDAISGATIVDVSVGIRHTLALDDQGKVWAWGYNNNSSVGIYTNNSYLYTPICISDMDGKLSGKKIKKICSGDERSVFIDEDGKVYTCGSNSYKSLGIGDTPYNSRTVYCLNELHETLKNVKFVDARYGSPYECCSHLILLDESGRVWTCGRNQNGELGSGSLTNDYETKPVCISSVEGSPLNGKKVVAIDAGCYHTSGCIDEDGNLYMWGYNSNGELGDGTNNSSAMPICLTQDENNRLYGKKITKLSLGYNVALCVDNQGKVYTTGANYSFQLGQGFNDTGKRSNVFVCINNKINFVPEDVDMGYYFGIGIDKEHNVWTWGDCSNYRNGANSQYSKPVKWIGPTEVYDSAVDTLNEANMIEIISHSDRISVSAQSTEAMEAQIPSNAVNVRSFYTGSYDNDGKYVYGNTYIALDANGKVWTWGINNNYGILGDGTTTPRYTKVCLNNKMNNVTIASILKADSSNIILKDTNGTLWGWGYNINSILGKLPAGDSFKEPINISKESDLEGKNVTKFYYNGNSYCYAIDSDGKVYSWGSNNGASNLGNGQTSGTAIPTKIGEDTDMENAVIDSLQILGSDVTIAYDNQGKVYGWGRNAQNQLLVGNTNHVPYPVRVGKGTAYSGLNIKRMYYLDSYNTMLLTTDNQLYTWGQNGVGITGNGKTVSNILEPTNLTELKNFRVEKIVLCGSTNIIIDTTGKVWTWGTSNTYGLLGIGTTYGSPSATCISRGQFKVKEVIGIYNNRIIVKDTDDKIWTWGNGTSGQCGNGSFTNILEPYCMTPDFAVKEVYATTNVTRVVDTEGNLWVCGANSHGECGIESEGNNINTLTKYPNNFEIETVYKSDYLGFIFKDTSGKTWASGYYTGLNPEDNVKTTVCISDNTDLAGKTLTYVTLINNTIFAKDTDGKLYSWGYNKEGQAGIGSDEEYTKPTCINKGDLADIRFNSVQSYNAGDQVMKAVDSNGKVWYWGPNKQLSIINQPLGNVTSPVCVTDVYEEIGYNPLEHNIIHITTGIKAFIDDDGKLWTWGSTGIFCGAGTNAPVVKPTCISTEYNQLNLKNGTIHYYSGFVYAINSDGEAWVWGRNLNYPIRLKNTTALKNVRIMEIGFDTSNGKLAVLTDGGEIYNIDTQNGIEISEKEYSGEVQETIGNITSRPFAIVTDAEYNK